MNAIQKLKWTRKYSGDVGRWLWGMKPLWLIIAAVLILLACVWFASCLEQRIRLFGMSVQLLGVVVVAVGLNDTRRAFNDLPTMWESIKLAWGARPRWPRNQIIAAGGLAAGSSFLSARMRTSPGPTASIDQRVAMLERQYAELFDEVGTLGGEVKKNIDELTAGLKAERKEREDGDVSIRTLLRRAIGEGILLQSFGVGFFLLGIVAGTASQEIARALGGAACPS